MCHELLCKWDACLYLCAWVCVRVYTPCIKCTTVRDDQLWLCLLTYIYTYIPIYVYTHKHIYIYTYTFTHTYAYTHTYTYTYTYAYTFTHTYIYMIFGLYELIIRVMIYICILCILCILSQSVILSQRVRVDILSGNRYHNTI